MTEIWKDETGRKSFKPGTSKFQKWYGGELKNKTSYDKTYTWSGATRDVAPHPDLSSPQSKKTDYGVIRMSKSPTSFHRRETQRKGRTAISKRYSTEVHRGKNEFVSSATSSFSKQTDIGPYSRNVAEVQVSTPQGIKSGGQVVSYEPSAVDVYNSTEMVRKRKQGNTLLGRKYG
tara:strand:+ start:81 stop:605 length:525 start_codon:yes stop_codon:yes gene_type:complete